MGDPGAQDCYARPRRQTDATLESRLRPDPGDDPGDKLPHPKLRRPSPSLTIVILYGIYIKALIILRTDGDKMKQSTDFDLSALEEMVLMVLLGGELYGLGIIKAIEDATDGKRRVGFGSLYPTLHQLEKRGLVKSNWGAETPKERSGARRRYYRITGLGKTAVNEAEAVRGSLTQWSQAWGRI